MSQEQLQPLARSLDPVMFLARIEVLYMYLKHGSCPSDDRVLGAVAFRELGQRLFRDQCLEMWGFLMSLECFLVLEHFVEEEFGGLRSRLVDEKSLNTGIL